MKMNKIASIEIQNQPIFINAVLNFLDAVASRHAKMEISRYNRLRYVVGEILEKRIKNAYPGTSGTIEVDVFLNEVCCEISIKDKGVPEWTDLSYDENADIHGKTIFRNFLLDQWIDEVGIEQLGKDGQCIFLRMNILHPFTFDTPEPYTETEALDTNISFRPVKTKEDAIEAIRCIYSEYGYSYSYERMYHIDQFMNMLKNGELMSFLAVNEHGQTAGHFALAFSDTFSNMPEITGVVTRKEFRGLGLFAKIMDYCMIVGKQHGIRAIMGQPVAFHPMSQKAVIKSGFTATSVLLSYIASDVESEYNKNNQRLDLFAAVKIMDESAKTTVYPPQALRPFVDGVFGKLGWQYEILPDTALSEHTEMRIENNGFLKSSKVLVYSASSDLKPILQDALKDAVRRKYEMVEMLISMNDPSCTYAYETAKECGFVLSGIIPGSERSDYLVMQFLIGTDCRYDQLVTVGEFEELTQSIIALNE